MDSNEIRIDLFSGFAQGYVNQRGVAVPQSVPCGEGSIKDVHAYIISDKAKAATEHLRTLTDKAENSEYKVLHFCGVTFSCRCTYRNAQGIVGLTPYMVLDFDGKDLRVAYPDYDIESILCGMRTWLLSDPNLCAELLFTSPNGDGLKVVLNVGDRQGLSHKDCFTAIAAYLKDRYGMPVDKSGSDVTRLCFLPYDPRCYIRPEGKAAFAPKVDLRAWLRKSMVDFIVTNPPCDNSFGGKSQNVFELIERWVSRDVSYAPGTYNAYVSRCGYLLCNFGVPEPEATQWAIQRFPDYKADMLRSVISSCYRNGQFGTRQFLQ